jgi:hypothetical protein
MDYGKVLSRAWEITWRWKVLWILGFLASLGSGMGSGSNVYSSNGEDWNRWGYKLSGPEFLPAIVSVLIALACLAFLVGIALWVISVMARGGLIAGVQQVEDESSTSFLQAWRVGRKRFWTLFGINVLAAIPLFILVLILVTLSITGIVAAGMTADSADKPVAVLSILVSTLFCGGTLCCGLILVGIVMGQIQIYADRAAILEGLGWIDAFKRGWQVLKENIGPTFVLWLIFLVIGLIIGAVIAAGLMAVALPFVAIFRNIEPGAWLIAPICCGGLLAMIVFALLSSIVQTFTSATWTLAYRELTSRAAKPAPEPATA